MHVNVNFLMVQSEFVLRILIAGICGVIIGYERMNRNKEAGVRTHAIVALSASLIMVISKYGFEDIPDYDAARVAAQVVSGIGFIGAGIIFVKNKMVSGLTTAAGIWATAGIGLAIGAGLYFVGIITTIMIVVIQVVMHRIKFLVQDIAHSTIAFTVRQKELSLKNIWEVFSVEKVEVEGMNFYYKEDGSLKVELEVSLPAGYDKMKLMDVVTQKWDVVKYSCY